MKALIVFRGGATITIDTNTIETTRSVFEGNHGYSSIKWETPGDWTAKLHGLDPEEVAAIVLLRTPEEGDQK